MKYLVLILALMFAAPVFAQEQTPSTAVQLTEEIAKMDDAQKQKALAAIKASESPTAASAREWIAIGEGLGEGMAATAAKMGVVANDFSQTPLGKMAMLLIIWNYMGESIVLLFAALGITVFGGGLWVYVSRKIFGEYNDKGKFIKYDTNLINRHGELVFAMIVAAGILFVATLICIANIS